MRDAQAAGQETVYLLSHPIPELGAQPGDHLIVDPADPAIPVQVVRNFYGRAPLVRLMGSGHLERAEIVAGPGVTPASCPPSPRLRAGRHLELI